MAEVYWYICTDAPQSAPIPPTTPNQAEFNRRIAGAMSARVKHDVGDLLARPIAKSIPNHLLCDGSAVGRDVFPRLFDEISTAWGEGDGTTTFNLPNLIGVALPVPVTAPTQILDEGGTVSAGEIIDVPEGEGEAGGTEGGNVLSGARPEYPVYDDDEA